jgi:hypothetical protein
MFMSDMLLRRGATGTECLADERVFRWGEERGDLRGEERDDLRGEERDEGCRFQVREEAEGVGSKASSSSSPSSVSSSEIDPD